MKDQVQRYSVSYRYRDPGPAGPFKGRTETTEKLSKGDLIGAPFGAAIVTSCRRKK